MDETAPWRALESSDSAARESRPGRATPTRLIAAAAVGLCLVSLALAAFVALRPGGQMEIVDGPGGPDWTAAAASASQATVVVQVCGAVLRPGVYALPAGSRVADAIKMAGGYSPDVDPRLAEEKLNLAARVQDAEVILVPRRGDDPAVASGATGSTAPGLVDLNTATAEELDTLPGIGPATAAKIIAAREQAPFTSIDDLVTRKVVSESVFEKLKALVTI
jgi:competence protein ComEA